MPSPLSADVIGPNVRAADRPPDVDELNAAEANAASDGVWEANNAPDARLHNERVSAVEARLARRTLGPPHLRVRQRRGRSRPGVRRARRSTGPPGSDDGPGEPEPALGRSLTAFQAEALAQLHRQADDDQPTPWRERS